jgi:O-antigen/teichoic acid export membrane protein
MGHRLLEGTRRLRDVAGRGRGDAVLTIAMRLGGAGAALVANIALARILGVEKFGFYSYGTSWLILLANPIVGGFQRIAVRDIAAEIARSDKAGAAATARRTVRASLAISGAVALTAAAVMILIAGIPHDTESAAVLVGILGVPLIVLALTVQALVRVVRRAWNSMWPVSVAQPLVLAVLVILFSARWHPSATVAVGYFLLSYVVALGLLAAQFRGRLPRPSGPAPRVRWRRSLTVLVSIGVGETIITRLPTVMLGLLGQPEKVGLFSVSIRAAEFTGFGLVALNMVLGPEIARLWAVGKVDALASVVTRTARGATGLTMLFAAAIGLVAPIYLHVLGKGFGAAKGTLRILIVAEVIDACAGSVGLVLTMIGAEAVVLKGYAVGAAATVAACLLLVPPFGAPGAAYACCIGTFTWNLMLVVALRRRTGIDSSPLGAHRRPLAGKARIGP